MDGGDPDDDDGFLETLQYTQPPHRAHGSAEYTMIMMTMMMLMMMMMIVVSVVVLRMMVLGARCYMLCFKQEGRC